ncbi:MAG: extracellular solute-binding protein [Clostridiales bacterium]|jgi:putative aldouronate transport system substrate-binding protein|nr:extracellular solute-binding protein [Clostridiales bacterium]
MNKNKLVAIILSIVLVCMILASCGNNTSDQKTSQDSTDVDESAEDVEESTGPPVSSSLYEWSEAMESILSSGRFPIVDEKIELTVTVPTASNVEDITTNEFTKFYEELTNIAIKWNVIPSESLTEKINISLSSGDMPDIYLNCNISQTQQQVYGSQGAFVALNGYIDAYDGVFKQVLEKVPNLRDIITMSDGNIYALPHIEKCNHCEVSNKMCVNRQWLDVLGLEIPKTVDEFTDMLRKFKTEDPNQNGEADEIPLLGYEGGWNSSIISGYLTNPFVYSAIHLENGKVKLYYIEDGWRDALKWLNQLYKEGLLYPQSFVIQQDQARQIAQSGDDVEVIGCYPNGVPSGAVGDRPEDWKNYIAIPPLEGPAGKYAIWNAYSQINPTTFVITSQCKYPEEAFRWGVELYDRDLYYLKAFGKEGVGWRKLTEEEKAKGINDLRSGTPSEVLVFADGIGWSDKQNYCWRGIGLRCDTTDFSENRYAQMQPGDYETDMEWRLALDTNNNYAPYVPPLEMVLPFLVYTEEQAAELANLETVINSYRDEMAARFITGDADIDNEWDKYIAEMKNKGVDKLLEIYQSAYDSKYGKK